jgi:hypothetical protein
MSGQEFQSRHWESSKLRGFSFVISLAFASLHSMFFVLHPMSPPADAQRPGGETHRERNFGAKKDIDSKKIFAP